MYNALANICADMEKMGLPFWKIVQLDDCKELNKTEEESFTHMTYIYEAMKSSNNEYEKDLISSSGLVGGDGEKLRERRMSGELLAGELLGCVMEKALRVAESNACMKRIVAAPTAGSCGVLPAVFLSVQEKLGYSDEKMVEALYVSAGVGGVIAARASLSGAAGGCQAEIGAASAMAAAGLVYLLGGDSNQICNASALALKNLLGLACDPVAGLVEVPCVKRNVMGAVNAVTSADLTMAGIVSRIPADEVFDAMNSIGRNMPEAVRETAKGGLATTGTGLKIAQNITSK